MSASFRSERPELETPLAAARKGLPTHNLTRELTSLMSGCQR